MSPRHDLILAGGGLANGLLAWRLATHRPELNVLVLERGAALGGNHTWSFHDGDLDASLSRWIAPLVQARWPAYEVRFPGLRRTLDSGYASVSADRFARVIGAALGPRVRYGVEIAALTPTSATLSDGTVLHAGAVVDGRGPQPDPGIALGWQAFLGQELRLARPHGLLHPIIMDATVAQGEGYRFVYVLPLAEDRLLVEDTHYVDRHDIAPQVLRGHIAAYARSQGWQCASVVREEQGVLPIVLAGDFPAYWRRRQGQPCVGLRAGLFHPTTGYSLPHAARLAAQLAGQRDLGATALFDAIHREASAQWQGQGFFRLLNRMLFLAGRPGDRWRVMQRFYGLPEPLIRRFYAGSPGIRDKARILAGKPPVPLLQAARAACRTHPHHIARHS